MGQKITLAEMAAAAQERADYHEASAHHFATEFVDPVRHAEHRQQAAIFHAMAKLLRILGTFEEKSRKFVAGLIEEHGR